MELPLLLLALLPAALAFECNPSAFQSILPSTATVASATSVPANATFTVPSSDVAYPTSPILLKSACAVEIHVNTSTSSYGFGLFLPDCEEGEWNQRYLAVGNGGFAGGINWLDMAAGLGYGFATMSTDTGHNSVSADGAWALNNKEALEDWGYRAMHESIVLSKQVVAEYYGSNARFNYYSGCSTGGRQGLKEVELFPDDFDGVLAGSPAWWTSHLQTWTVKAGLYNLPVDAPHHIPTELFDVIGDEVLRQCDGQDGLVDGIISDPQGCVFLPEALLCSNDDMKRNTSSCLSGAQVDTLYKIYNNYVETNQTFVFPHLQLGSEAQWSVLLGGDEPNGLGIDYVRYFLLNQPDWNFWDFDFDIVKEADAEQPGNATVTNFDFSPFYAKGGKLLQYHGLADGLIPTGSSPYFYQQVLKTLRPKGIDLDAFYRFFLVPGMQHCAGTPSNVRAPWYFAGANQAGVIGQQPGSVSGVPGFRDAEHDVLLALVRWTEDGVAPERIVATEWRNETVLGEGVLRQRPLCMYPKKAKYAGRGNPDDASNWLC